MEKAVIPLLLTLVSTIPHSPEVRESVDLVERSHVYDLDGREVFVQWLVWHWEGDRHHIAAWRMANPGFHFQERPPQLTWTEGDRVRQVRAAYWRETHEQFDVEIAEREILHQDKRKGLAK